MKKTILTAVAALLVCTLLLAGCGSPPASGEDKPQSTDGGSQTSGSGELLNYDLGQGTLKEAGGKEVKYEIQGVLGIPKEKNCPVVVLLHGSHPIEKASEARYDTGFNYLSQTLSEKGCLVISMNVAINYSFEDGEPSGNERSKQVIAQQLELLKKAVDGDKSVYGRDVTGAGDFSRIVVMGHSRGGLDAIECEGSLPEGMKLAGIVCVAPSEYKPIETKIPDVPIGIIIPQMDGDVISLEGSNIYEELLTDKEYGASAELIYLKKANHGHFNTQLTEPDLNHNEADVAKLMPARQQQDFLLGYLTDFVNSAVKSGQTVFSSAAELGSTAYGCDVLLRVHTSGEELLWQADGEAAPDCTGSATQALEISSTLPAKNTVGAFKMPLLSFESYALRHISWGGGESSVTVPISGSIEGNRFVDIDMAIDSTDMKNKSGQAMTLILTDEAGKSAEVSVPATSAALLWQEGELIEQAGWDGEKAFEYSTFTPLVTQRVELARLSGVDLSRLKSVKLSWTDADGGSMMLRSISTVK